MATFFELPLDKMTNLKPVKQTPTLQRFLLWYDYFVKSLEHEVAFKLTVDHEQGRENLFIRMERLCEKPGNQSGLLIKCMDISESYQLLNDLEEKNRSLQVINHTLREEIIIKRRLTIEKERNHISKEVHDILGHSITLVIALLEAAKQKREDHLPEVLKDLKQSVQVTRKGLKQRVVRCLSLRM